jgi:transcriptional regulator with GAF, ATPase, and Fis domain
MTADHRTEIAAELLQEVVRSGRTQDFLSPALSGLQRYLKSEGVALVSVQTGEWRTVAVAGAVAALPIDLLSAVLDSDTPQAAQQWAVAPLDRHAAQELLIAGGGAHRTGREILPQLTEVTATFDAALQSMRSKEQLARRIERLEAILQIAASWRETGELEPLLVQMAEAASRLLEADRASIFLWDRENHTLVGRPALGVEGNELRIADDAGIVGQVVQSGVARMVNSALDQREINRQVDRSTGYQTRSLVCVPMRRQDGEIIGAFEVINKRAGTFNDDDETALAELASHAARAIETTRQFEQLLSTHRTLVDQAAERVRLVGDSPAMATLRTTTTRVAATELSVLVLGENGTGKEVVAQSIHYQSPRRAQPFVAVNCAAIAETLLESELFGHEKGSFTDARETRIGKFELAHHGTLFLDEIGDLSAAGQAKLLRVLEEKVVVRVGGSKPIHADVRVIAATNQDLAAMVREKRFRQDLFFRLNVVTLELPPLRQRGDDALQLAEHFLAHFCRQAKRKTLKLAASARKRLLQHPWPGNVRELRNLMERLAYLADGDTIEGDDLALIAGVSKADAQLAIPGGQELAAATDAFQIVYIQQAIATARGNVSDAAERLGLHRSNLYRKMRQLGMEAREET